MRPTAAWLPPGPRAGTFELCRAALFAACPERKLIAGRRPAPLPGDKLTPPEQHAVACRLVDLAEAIQARAQRQDAGVVEGEIVEDDETIRLAAGALTLLDHHQVNGKGRCRRCRHSGRWVCFGRKQRCLVYAVLSLYLEQPMEVARGRVRDSV